MKKRQLGFCFVVALWAGLALFAWLKPEGDSSQWERRKLARFPDASVSGITSGRFMSQVDTAVTDQFPLRDQFRTLKAIFGKSVLREKDNHGLYLAQGQIAKLEYPLNSDSLEAALARFQSLYTRYLTDSERILMCPVPDKGYYLAAENGYPAMDYDAFFSTFENVSWADFADIRPLLTGQDYYSTDTHWRQEKLYPVAALLAKKLGVELEPESAYVQKTLTDAFYGVYYGQSALPVQPDSLQVMTSANLANCVVTNLENGEVLGVYDLEKLEGDDPYEVFLSGSVSLITIENPAADASRELIVFRDSFGSSLVPLLSSGYGKITLIDIRYLPSANLGRFVDFHGQDVLFLYSTLVLNNSETLK